MLGTRPLEALCAASERSVRRCSEKKGGERSPRRSFEAMEVGNRRVAPNQCVAIGQSDLHSTRRSNSHTAPCAPLRQRRPREHLGEVPLAVLLGVCGIDPVGASVPARRGVEAGGLQAGVSRSVGHVSWVGGMGQVVLKPCGGG